MFTIEWQHTNIGGLSGISSDMWYIEGIWTPNETAAAKDFAKRLNSYDLTTALQDPDNAMKILLIATNDENKKLYCLVMSLKADQLAMRQVVAEAALDKFFPDR